MDTSTGATVRSATLGDAEALADFLLELGLFPSLEAFTRDGLVRLLEPKLAAAQTPSHTLLVAELHAELRARIVGYAAVHWLPTLFQPGPDGYLSELFVVAAARGQSVGARLLHAVCAEAKRRGCGRLTLINRHDRESYRREFYVKQGWTEQPEAARFVYVLEN